jgi:lysophospholipase
MSVKTPQAVVMAGEPEAAPAAVPSGLMETYVAANCYGVLERAGGLLRYAHWSGAGVPRGTVVVMPGRAEFIEKYATEVAGELLARGYAVMSMDWRGQGLSSRALADRHKGDIDSFATYIADFELFLREVVIPTATPPVMVLCHSMGAHIVMRALAENGSGPFSAALFVSPMTGLRREGLLRCILMAMPAVPWIDEHYLFSTGRYAPEAQPFSSNILTRDERRYRFTEAWFAADPRLALGGPTFGWARQAVRSMALARSAGYLERIELPALVLSGSDETLVDAPSHAVVASRLRHGEQLVIDGARHEIMMETDPIRGQFWQAFDRLAKGAKL